jgi:hypothetical protein
MIGAVAARLVWATRRSEIAKQDVAATANVVARAL